MDRLLTIIVSGWYNEAGDVAFDPTGVAWCIDDDFSFGSFSELMMIVMMDHINSLPERTRIHNESVGESLLR